MMSVTNCVICNKQFEQTRGKRHSVCSADCRKEKSRRFNKEYYRLNREGALERQKRYYDTWKENNPGQHYYGTEYRLYYGARDRCQKSGMDFSISVEDIVVPERCPILDVLMVRGGRYAPSLDRKDSLLGYTKENIWVISKLANRMKNDATIEELQRFGKWLNSLR